MSEEEFNELQKELEPFVVKRGSEKQVKTLKERGVDLTGFLDLEGLDKWLVFKKVVRFDGKYGPILRVDEKGKVLPQYFECMEKIEAYRKLLHYKKIGRLSKAYFKPAEIKEIKKEVKDDIIKVEDIPF